MWDISQGGSLVPLVYSCKVVANEKLFSLLALMKETIFFDISFIEACVCNNTNAGIAIYDYIFMKCNFFVKFVKIISCEKESLQYVTTEYRNTDSVSCLVM